MKYCDTNQEAMYSPTEISTLNKFPIIQKKKNKYSQWFLLLPDYKIRRSGF